MVIELLLSILEKKKLKKVLGSIFNSMKSYLIQDPPGTVADTSMMPLMINTGFLLFTIDKTWKQPKCPAIDEWIEKM